ncbi:uncharacterized protein LOC129151748 [Eptesicus fuscus]|uniref:uncharacterized protein LOC129151748 n=1 Tax=Eptesicus fuscus TaxID=29078 RepID=UPI002403EF31|nr:uncharacterized protein LOC129151748 [Eptesicus fuscus]
MFSCCLPVCRDRGLKRGSDESRFRRARRWIRTQSRRLWPFARRDQERSTLIKEEQQLVEEDSFPMSRSEGPVSHTTEGQDSPEVCVATWAAGEPGPVVWRTPRGRPTSIQRPPTTKLLRPNMHMLIFNYYLRRYEPVTDTIWEDLESKEAEPQGKEVGVIGVGWEGRSM